MTYIKTIYGAMSTVSRVIIKAGYALLVLVIAVSMFIIVFAESFFADYTTAFYWYEQCVLLGREVLGATVVPAMLFEIIMKIIFKKK